MELLADRLAERDGGQTEILPRLVWDEEKAAWPAAASIMWRVSSQASPRSTKTLSGCRSGGKGGLEECQECTGPCSQLFNTPPSTLCYYLTGHNSTREDLSHHSNSVRYMFPDCLSSLTSCPTDKAVLSLHVSGRAAAVENIQGVCVHGTASQGVRVHVPACKSTQAPEQASRESSATPGPGNLPFPPLPSPSLKAGRKERAAWLHANHNNSQQPSKS